MLTQFYTHSSSSPYLSRRYIRRHQENCAKQFPSLILTCLMVYFINQVIALLFFTRTRAPCNTWKSKCCRMIRLRMFIGNFFKTFKTFITYFLSRWLCIIKPRCMFLIDLFFFFFNISYPKL